MHTQFLSDYWLKIWEQALNSEEALQENDSLEEIDGRDYSFENEVLGY